ncbi:MAG: hypothetical protein HC918_09610 [Oscillatoriales cyanobacterium SM2_1_8]|nr:hypothetical protein [Oscillatoriales cyanobacterium SM2_1_8]
MPERWGTPSQSPPVTSLRSKAKGQLWVVWLKRLRFVSGLAAVLATAGALGVYSLTDRTRKDWNAGREKLDTLRRQERQLTATLSELDNQQTSRLYDQPGDRQRVKPTTAVFTEVAPLRPETVIPAPPPPGPPAQPLGY